MATTTALCICPEDDLFHDLACPDVADHPAAQMAGFVPCAVATPIYDALVAGEHYRPRMVTGRPPRDERGRFVKAFHGATRV